MARILFWNINNFTFNKIGDPTDLANAQDRRAHIVDEVLLGLPAPPDIFVIVEVHGRAQEVGEEGTPAIGNARRGVQSLLNYMRTQTGNPWMLVPPVWSGALGMQEGVAVFYNSLQLQFAGPYVIGPDYRTATYLRSGTWTKRPLRRACPLAMTQPAGGTPPLPPTWQVGPQDYLLWNGCLPTRVTPGGVLPIESRLAGQWEFYDAYNNRISFPAGYNRSPFYTRFIEWPAGRIIKLFAMHTSPGTADQAVQQLAHVAELAPAANEVTVVGADFNVDTFDDRGSYDGLIGALGGGGGLGMTLAFRPDNGGAIQAARKPYCMTHYLPTAHATPYGVLGGVIADPTHNVYPRFGCMGAMGGWLFQTPGNSGAIDNFLTWYGGGIAGGPAANPTIVNKVTGTPYNQAPAPANVTGELTGSLATASSLAVPIPQPNGEDSTAFGSVAMAAMFQTWQNFGRIHSTSDHLPICIDV